MFPNRTVRLLTCAILASFAMDQASAGVFDVKGSDVEKGEKEISVNSTFFNGFPVNAEALRSTIEIGAGYGFSDWWKAGAKITLNKAVGDDLVASTAGIEAQIVLRKFDKGFGAAWFMGADFALRDDETNTLTFGPVFQFGTEKTQFLVNPFFARTFGQNRTDGLDFSYAVALKQEVRDGFSVGIEAYGSIANISNSLGTDFQEHRIGPVLYFSRDLHGKSGSGKGLSIKDMKAPAFGGGDGKDASSPKLNIEAGVLFGLTDGTQDVAFKLKGGITF